MCIKENDLGLRQHIMTYLVIKGAMSTTYSQIVQRITYIEREKEEDRGTKL